MAAGAGEARYRSPTAEEIGLSPATHPIVSDTEAHIASEPYRTPLPQQASLNLPAPTPALDSPVQSQSEVWALRDQLQLLHAGLHPADSTRSELFARAMRHLQERDPKEAKEVRELVVGASRGLKAAFLRIEKLFEAPEFDPFGNEEDEPIPIASSLPIPPSLAALEPQAPLSPTRQAAARRSVGRTLRTELQEEKQRFFEAAKRHELPVGRKSKETHAASGGALV